MVISLVTPTLDSAAVLATALQSVLAQELPGGISLEHIIVDGCSADDTLAVAESFRSRYASRGFTLSLSSEPDSGIYDALNRGISRATGDLIGILHSDDMLARCDAIALVAGTFSAHPDTQAVYADVQYVSRHCPGLITRRYSSRLFRRRLMPFGFQPPHPTFYCRREVYSRFGLYDPTYKISGDFDFMLRALWRGRIAARRIDATLVTMRTGGATDRSWRSHLLGWREHERAYRRLRVPGSVWLELPQLLYKLFQLTPAAIFHPAKSASSL